MSTAKQGSLKVFQALLKLKELFCAGLADPSRGACLQALREPGRTILERLFASRHDVLPIVETELSSCWAEDGSIESR
jgi:hypothetical protein